MNYRQLLSTCLLALSLAIPLAACGGQSSSASVASGSDKATAASSSQGSNSENTTKNAVTKETFEGDWVGVKMHQDGATVYGDLSSFDFRSTVSFGKDGPYRIDNGAKVTFSKGSFTLLNDGDYLIADMAELAGERLYYVLVRA